MDTKKNKGFDFKGLKYVPKHLASLSFFLLYGGVFILILGRKTESLRVNFLLQQIPTFYQHVLNFALSYFLYAGIGYFWLMMDVKFRYIIAFGIALLLANLIYEEGKVPGFFQSLGDPFSFWYCVVFGILVVLFTFFYTAVTIPVNQMAEDLRRNGGIIPRVKPGKDTANYLDDILSKITLPGAIFLALLAILPAIVYTVGVGAGFAYFFGGTSLLILVGVTLDTMQQINTYLLNHHYDGMMQTDRVSKKMA